jgi:protein TonB
MRPWVTPGKDPLAAVLNLGGDRAMAVMAVAIVLTLAAHGAAAVRTAYIHAEMIAWTLHLDTAIDHKLTQQIDIEAERPTPPREEKKDDPPPVVNEAKHDLPVAAAQAAQILARNPDNEVLDFGDNVFTVGDSERYSGGQTMSNGTNTRASNGVHVAATGTPAPPPPPQIVSVDLSRTARLAGSGEWRCPFPPEADADQVDDASAIIEVIVGGDGKASRANILSDPGHGFGREARACAMREAYVPALDRDGKAVASSKKFRVKFER